MLIFENDNINLLYKDLIKNVYENGNSLEKKNGTVLKEIVPAVIHITDPLNSIITHEGRPYNVAFMVAETLWNLCGEVDDWLCKYNKLYEKYFTNGKLYAGYGNRILNGTTNQLQQVINWLKKDCDTSRATISIFNQNEDSIEGIFVPCINFIKFRIIDNKLNMFTFMRAQDLWRGFPYDLHLLISIFIYTSILLNVEIGDYYHICDSIRLYDDDSKDIEDFLKIKNCGNKPDKMDFGLDSNNVEEKINYYCNIISGKELCSIEKIMQEPRYWKNSILSCLVYNGIKSHNYNFSYYLLNRIDNYFKKQIFIWSKRYFLDFYNYLLARGEKIDEKAI